MARTHRPRRHTSRVRRGVQAGFLLLVLVGVYVVRGNAERWCPFGGVEALWAYVTEGNVLCSIGVSNFFILGGVLLSVLLLRRAFCGYACPVGTISEWTGSLGRRLGLRALPVPRRLDAFFSLFKYAALGVIVYLTWKAGELIFRGFDPCYAFIGRHGEDITFWAYVVSAGVLLASLVLSIPFCRWLCPLAAVLNPFSRVAPGRIVRDDPSCVTCGKCAAACPMAIPVDRLQEVRAARCTSCLACLDACPKHRGGTLAWRVPGLARGVPRGALAGALVLLLGAAVGAAELWPLPSFRWSRGQLPAQSAVLDLEVEELSCRGRANLLVYYLDRDDELAIPGALHVEAWPGPGAAPLRVSFDPTVADAAIVRQAIVEPYYDYHLGTWRPSPFRIPGYDPLAAP